MADRPTCEECHRPLLRPSPDRLGPKCRRKRRPTRARPASAALPVRPGAMAAGQESLFELEEYPNEDH